MKAIDSRINQYTKRNKSQIYHRTPITIEDSTVCILYKAQLTNLDGRDLYFETRLLLPIGTKVYICIHDSSDGNSPAFQGRILVEIIYRNRLIKEPFNYSYGAKVIFRSEPKDFRRNPRKSFSKPIFFASQDDYYEGVIKNLSQGGAFIEGRAKLKNGTKLKLVIPDTERHIILRSKIIHVKQTGFGVKFENTYKICKKKKIRL